MDQSVIDPKPWCLTKQASHENNPVILYRFCSLLVINIHVCSKRSADDRGNRAIL
jgi:hypothetical protein